MLKRLGQVTLVFSLMMMLGCSGKPVPEQVVVPVQKIKVPSYTIDGHPWPMKIGEPFPDAPFLGPDGKPWRMSQLKGKVVFFHTAQMDNPTSIALAGGNKVGHFMGLYPRKDRETVELDIRKRFPGFSLDDPRIVVLEVITRNLNGERATAEDINRWANHFKPAREANVMVVGATEEMLDLHSVGSMPGNYLIDEEGVTRYGYCSSKKVDPEIRSTFYRAIIRLVDSPPERSPAPSSEEIQKVTEAYQASSMTPLKSATGSTVLETLTPSQLSYLKAVSLDLFEGTGNKQDEQNKNALAFFEKVNQGDTSDETLALAKQISTDGCDDPIFQLVHARLLLRRNDPSAAEEKLRAALKKLDDAKYPPIVRFRARQSLTLAILRGSDFSQGRMFEKCEIAKQAADDFAAACATPGMSAVTQEIISDEVQNAFSDGQPFYAHIWDFANAVQKQEGIDPWLVEVVLGKCHRCEAWRQRGNGYASTVTKEGWQGLQTHNNAAAAYYLRAWIRRPEITTAAKNMIDIITTGKPIADESIRFWFDQVVKYRFDDMDAYNAVLMRLRPRWGGSPEQMLAFGNEALGTERFDTHVPYVFIDALLTVAQEIGQSGGNPQLAFRIPGVKQSIIKVYEGYIPRPTLPEVNRRALRQEYALLLYQSDAVDAAREQYKNAGEEIPEHRFATFFVDRRKFEKAMKEDPKPNPSAVMISPSTINVAVKS